jgi:arylsulfatase A-like enzyme
VDLLPAKHIVLIIFDYMGYADLEPFGKSEIRTPNIRRLAEQGVIYTDAYGAAPICGPSRAAMLTGRYPWRVGVEKNVEPGEVGLPASEKTLAKYFRDHGFATALHGKWHLGDGADETPKAHGFDEFLGFYEWNIDYYSHKTESGSDALYHNEEVVHQDGYTTDLFTDAAVSFINEKRAEPFFLYLAYNAMLPPYSPPGLASDEAAAREWVRGSRADYVSGVEHLDHGVGRVLDTLEKQGLVQDTVVLLTYDHGGGEMATKGPFFHGFGTLWEGGIRVPMILRWPVCTRARGTSAEPVIIMDVAATLLAAAGIEPDQPMDGVDLLHPSFHSRPPRPLMWRIDLPGEGDKRSPRAQRAARRENWKYIWDGGTEFLFDLDQDPGERNDLGYQNPELLAELRALSTGPFDTPLQND